MVRTIATSRKVVKRKERPKADVKAVVVGYFGLKRMYDEVNSKFTEAKSAVKALVDELGETDDKGHRWLDLKEYGVDLPDAKTLKHERRVSAVLDKTEAEALLDERNLLDRCSSTTVTLRGAWDEFDVREIFSVVGSMSDSEISGDDVLSVEGSLNEDEIYACVFDPKANLSQEDIDDITNQRISWALKSE